jgi:hypothetical protein
MTSCVGINIRANAETIWNLLTDSKGFPRWNSTVSSVEGEISEGQRIVVRVPGTDRKFTPTVSGVAPNQRMIWTGGFAPMFKGVRRFELKPQQNGSIDFVMEECFSGLMLPLVGRSLPDFKPIFERYASDLKIEAEGSNPALPR